MCIPGSRVMSEKTQITDKYPTSTPRTRLATGDCTKHYINENNSTPLFSPLSVTAVLTAWRIWRLQNHIHWINLFQLISFHPVLSRTACHIRAPKDQVYSLQRLPARCKNLFHIISPAWTISENQAQLLLTLAQSFSNVCGHNMCQIYMSNDSVIRNQLLYQLCTRELLWHWHFHYWCLDVLWISCGFTVTDTSCLWDHSFDPYSFTALYRAESKFLLLILSFEFQEQQPAGRRRKTKQQPSNFLCKNILSSGDLLPMLCNNFHCSPWHHVL